MIYNCKLHALVVYQKTSNQAPLVQNSRHPTPNKCQLRAKNKCPPCTKNKCSLCTNSPNTAAPGKELNCELEQLLYKSKTFYRAASKKCFFVRRVYCSFLWVQTQAIVSFALFQRISLMPIEVNFTWKMFAIV